MSDKEIKFTTGYSQDALFIDKDTGAGEIHEFVKERIRNPVAVNGRVVWNFSTHEVDEVALKALEPELDRNFYRIRYNVPEAWAYMTFILPAKVREAGILHYQPEYGGYMEFDNFFCMSDYKDRGGVADGLEEAMAEGLMELGVGTDVR